MHGSGTSDRGGGVPPTAVDAGSGEGAGSGAAADAVETDDAAREECDEADARQ
jgi:hypothetical protein